MKKSLLLLFICLSYISCSSQRQYSNISQKEACVFLWMNTQRPWSGSFKGIKELVEYWNADVNFIHPYESPKTTPILNASGALERLKEGKQLTKSQIDCMEQEAIKIVKYLAKKGANIHATSTSRKLNALHLAACGGRDKMIPVLIDLGLDINSTDSLGGTTLIHAIAAADLATVKSTVESGANINQCTPDGNSPLDWAQYYVKIKDKTFAKPYNDQEAIVEYMQSIGAKQGKNDFTGNLYN